MVMLPLDWQDLNGNFCPTLCTLGKWPMLLRRMIEHVRKQDWFAVAIDFVVVVVGVFLGIQLGNWNDERVFDNHERTLLLELRAEIAQGIELTNGWREYLDIVSEAGARSIAYLDSDLPCGDDCWERIIDFFHASQFISVDLDPGRWNKQQLPFLRKAPEFR